ATFVATILDVVAAAEVIVAHGGLSSGVPDLSFDGARKRESSTRHIRKISVAFINIVAGKNCLVRQPVDASKFFRGPSSFFREKFTAFLPPRSVPRAARARNTL
ncbi:hypothetical protein, partial [Bradyrhizobium sp. WBAH30]